MAWFSPVAIHSKCGETSSYIATQFIDGDVRTAWFHRLWERHWIIVDLGGTTLVRRIRIWHARSYQTWWHTFDVYVGDDPANLGTAVASNLNMGWPDNPEWKVFNTTDKEGRYIKLADILTMGPEGAITGHELEADVEEVPEEYKPWDGVLPTALCDTFYSIATFFKDLAADIRVAWLIGEYLAYPFEFVGGVFDLGGNFCHEFVDFIEGVLNLFEDRLSWTTFETFLRENLPGLFAILDDPVGWFLVQLTLAFDLEPWHTQSLEFFAKWILEEYFPTLYQIWLNPPDWFALLFEQHFPTLYYLVVDPAGELLYLIGLLFDLEPYQTQTPEHVVKALVERYFPTLYQLWLDPERWLEEHVDPRITAALEAIADFLADPWAWLFARYEGAFGTFSDRLYSLAEHTLRFFWEGEW